LPCRFAFIWPVFYGTVEEFKGGSSVGFDYPEEENYTTPLNFKVSRSTTFYIKEVNFFKLQARSTSISHEEGGGEPVGTENISALIPRPLESSQQTEQVNPAYAGRLNQYLSQWAEITNDQRVLSWISGFKIPFIKKPTQRGSYMKLPNNPTNLVNLKRSIAELINKGAISKSVFKPGQFLSSYFLIPKPDGSWRFILNLKPLNRYIHAPHFKLEDYRMVFKLIYPNCFFTKLDLKDAYFFVPIHPRYRKYLAFVFKRSYYHFNCLPFGLSIAPYLFTKIMKPGLGQLRSHNIVTVWAYYARYSMKSMRRNIWPGAY